MGGLGSNDEKMPEYERRDKERIAKIDAKHAKHAARIKERRLRDTPKKGNSPIPSPQGSPMRIRE